MPQIIQRSFTGGELTPALRSRADLTKYATGLALCENCIIKPQGGAYSRAGTKFIGALDDQTKKGRLVPFSFNDEQTYVLVFEHLKMFVIKDGGYVLDGVGPAIYELVTPYTEAEIPRLQFSQDADVVTITHRSHDTKTLSRLDHDDWVLADVDFAPPYDPPEWVPSVPTPLTIINSITRNATGTCGTVTPHGLTTGQLVTLSGVVGMTEVNGIERTVTVNGPLSFDLNVDTSFYTPYTSGGTINVSADIVTVGSGAGSYLKNYKYVITRVNVGGGESLPSEPREMKTNTLSSTAGLRLRWETESILSVGPISHYRVYKETSNASGVYGWIGDTKNVFFEDYNVGPDSTDAPPSSNIPFNLVDTKPASVGQYQQRKIYASSSLKKQTLYISKVGQANSLRFSTPSRSDDAIEFTIKTQDEIRHVVDMSSILVLTAGQEYIITEGQDEVLTPSTVGARRKSTNGASWTSPVTVNNSVIYVQEKGQRVREFSQSAEGYSNIDLSIMAEHLLKGHTIDHMWYSAEPDSILWFIRDDGVLLGLTYQKEHQVWAWHHHTTDGEFESGCSISEGGRDASYVIVKRVVNGSTVRYVERFEPEATTIDDVFCVDSGLTYEGSPATTITGLDHIVGKNVAVLADGNEVESLTVGNVSGGVGVVLPDAASRVVVGLPYVPVIETLDVDSPSESVRGRDVSVSKVMIEVVDSRGGWIGPKSELNSTVELSEIKPRFEYDNYDALPLKTFKQEVIIAPTWSKGGGVRIEQRSPLPLSIISIIPSIDVS
jgi:hypothetical protein